MPPADKVAGGSDVSLILFLYTVVNLLTIVRGDAQLSPPADKSRLRVAHVSLIISIIIASFVPIVVSDFTRFRTRYRQHATRSTVDDGACSVQYSTWRCTENTSGLTYQG